MSELRDIAKELLMREVRELAAEMSLDQKKNLKRAVQKHKRCEQGLLELTYDNAEDVEYTVVEEGPKATVIQVGPKERPLRDDLPRREKE